MISDDDEEDQVDTLLIGQEYFSSPSNATPKFDLSFSECPVRINQVQTLENWSTVYAAFESFSENNKIGMLSAICTMCATNYEDLYGCLSTSLNPKYAEICFSEAFGIEPQM